METEKKILVVDDDPLMRKSAAVYLQDAGYTVLQADNGRKGLETFRTEKPDLILLDLRMPEMDGLEVLGIVAKESPDVPLIIVSGAGSLEDGIKALRHGAWDYVIKPISDLSLLEHSIASALEHAVLIRENKRYQLHLEEVIRQRSAELQKVQKLEAIGTLAGGIAHDFNNILSAILGYSEMAREDLPDDSQARKDIDKVIEAGKRATELVRQILTFSRQDSQDFKPMQIQFIIKEALKLLRSTIPTTIEIRESIDTNCGPILANATQIHQLLMNLCTNAQYAMLEKGGILTVSLSRLDVPVASEIDNVRLLRGTYAKLTVADTGIGMDSATLSKIFDPFFTTKEIGKGSGLGLSVVHGIVNTHNGRITVASRPGKGTEFNLYFPMIDIREQPEKQEDFGELPRGDERVLVVDDVPEIVEMIHRMLEGLGYRVRSFTNSSAALHEFQKNTEAYDLVITDMTMPGLNGAELAGKILEERPRMPVIMCSGFSEIMDEAKAKALGIREYIMKPVVKSELAKVVRKVLDHG